MRSILSDHNIEGHLNALVTIWKSGYWAEIWSGLALSVETFRKFGIAADIKDDMLWRLCQRREIVLFTANRNSDGSDSLEATIAREGDFTSLPVITLSNPLRFSQDRQYAAGIAERALDYLLDMDNPRGAGRLFL